jgi:hypothetical protein
LLRDAGVYFCGASHRLFFRIGLVWYRENTGVVASLGLFLRQNLMGVANWDSPTLTHPGPLSFAHSTQEGALYCTLFAKRAKSVQNSAGAAESEFAPTTSYNIRISFSGRCFRALGMKSTHACYCSRKIHTHLPRPMMRAPILWTSLVNLNLLQQER